MTSTEVVEAFQEREYFQLHYPVDQVQPIRRSHQVIQQCLSDCEELLMPSNI
jgi:hypothetical protein